jgi:hypothetical protein
LILSVRYGGWARWLASLPFFHKLSVGGQYDRSIENGQHWVLDVGFHEDAARQQDRNGSANLGAVRRLLVSLLRQEKTLKRGAKAKRMACALDTQYLLRVLATAEIDA